MNKKKIIAIILVLVVLLLGGASIYIATQMSTKQAVAPTAPESKPAASDVGVQVIIECNPTTNPPINCPDGYTCVTSSEYNGEGASGTCVLDNWVGSAECNVTATATDPVCVPDGTVTCSPDCPTECGVAASTITTCKDSCNIATTKSCSATEDCAQAVIEGEKKAFKNVTSNTPGKYSLTTQMDVVSKSQIYVYAIELKNTSTVNAPDVVMTDSLKDLPLTFMDAAAGCNYNATEVKVTCTTTIEAGKTKTLSFRVKASDAIANGTVITNVASVVVPGGTLDLTNTLAVSTVVGCNHTCTTSEECSTNLTCDTTTSKCRVAACVTEDDCTCPKTIPTKVVTQQPTVTKVVTTVAPTAVVTAAATPTILPETGIFDLPGVAAFGGGLFLAVIGILLAL